PAASGAPGGRRYDSPLACSLDRFAVAVEFKRPPARRTDVLADYYLTPCLYSDPVNGLRHGSSGWSARLWSFESLCLLARLHAGATWRSAKVRPKSRRWQRPWQLRFHSEATAAR